MIFNLYVSSQIDQSLRSFYISLSCSIIEWSLLVSIRTINISAAIFSRQLNAFCMTLSSEVKQYTLSENINISDINSMLNESLYCLFAEIIAFNY